MTNTTAEMQGRDYDYDYEQELATCVFTDVPTH